MTATKIAPGLYEVPAPGRTFIIERCADGTWQLSQETGTNSEYCNHFMTKRRALEAVAAILRGED